MLRMAFVGLGQYGGRQVDSFLALDSTHYSGMAVNTADNDLAGLQHVLKGNQFHLTGTNGAGRTPQIAYDAFLNHAADFFEMVQRVTTGADQVWLVAGLGGGTGTGGLLLLLEHMDGLFANPPGLIITVPRASDGAVQTMNALPVIQKMQDAIDHGLLGSVLILDNDKFYKEFADQKRAGDWRNLSNEFVASTLHELNLLSGQAGIANFDREDFRKVLSVPGCLAVASVALAQDLAYTSVAKQIETSLTKGFLSDGYRLQESKVYGACFTVSEKGRTALLKAESQRHIENQLMSLFPNSYDRYMAIYEGDENKVMTVVGGLGFPARVLDLPKLLDSFKMAEVQRFDSTVQAGLGGLSSLLRPTQAPKAAANKDNPFLRKNAPTQPKANSNPFLKK
ncbi:hypothetical protein [Alicyclobacillus ferrooxydans]|uniref:Tubulin/FtsZ GTPase domain-containing protein n=1 Tax=Alicyclobacillus ferrooxydans TaxID=471514 RepID=A0A0P9CZW9_9BACL|nr:hypothetical protein [Alicyclobacillus ferrooxydans]KPV42708.1 hypothetical protein AN477_16395 [Alicyclobacillus ferrooxydans]